MEPVEKFFIGLIIAILATVFVMNERTINRKMEERKSDSYLVSRIVECEHQIASLRDRVSDLEASR